MAYNKTPSITFYVAQSHLKQWPVLIVRRTVCVYLAVANGSVGLVWTGSVFLPSHSHSNCLSSLCMACQTYCDCQCMLYTVDTNVNFIVYIFILWHVGIDGRWLDATMAISETPIQSVISKQLPQGGVTILECRPQTNDPFPSNATVSWLRNKALISDGDRNQRKLDKWTLLIQNFSVANEKKVVEYTCIVAGLRHFNVDFIRKFSLSVSDGKWCIICCGVISWIVN